MTREECKKVVLEMLDNLGGARMDEFVSFVGLHRIIGFTQVFHPDMISQLVLEGNIVQVKCNLPDKREVSFLLPKNTKISTING
jgi:hypothetical protein